MFLDGIDETSPAPEGWVPRGSKGESGDMFEVPEVPELPIPDPQPIEPFTSKVVMFDCTDYQFKAGYRGEEFHVVYLPLTTDGLRALRGGPEAPEFVLEDAHSWTVMPFIDCIREGAKRLGFGKRVMRLKMTYRLLNDPEKGLLGDFHFFPAPKRRVHFQQAFDVLVSKASKQDVSADGP